MTPKKWAGESMAGSETMIMAITIGVEILWRAGSSPRGSTMAPSNEGEDLEQCPISPPSGGRSRAQIAHLGKVFCHSTAHLNVHYTHTYIDSLELGKYLH